METADTVIKSALQEILVQAVESPLQPSEYQDGILYLNRMMNALAVKGINVGYTQISTLGDDITVPDGALDAIVANLAVRLFPQFSAPGTPINPLLIQAANDGMGVLRHLAITMPVALFPDTLPIGSGNEDDVLTEKFYSASEEELLGEQGGYISIESETPIP